MFGIAVARLDQVSDAEKARYQAFYCGLCRALKDRYGQVSRVTLSYDLTFLVILCDSLHEPAEETGEGTCVTHPAKPYAWIRSRYSDYAADLSVALAYHKCLDDVEDDDSAKAKAASALLRSAYVRAEARIPDQCLAIEQAMALIRKLEADPDTPPDEASHVFGNLLGALFSYDQGIWAGAMRTFGQELGHFIYLMDAAVDYKQDEKSGSYNPFVRLGMSPEAMRDTLEDSIAMASSTFEKLPLENDIDLLRSVLYAGVWQKFNREYEDDSKGANAR